MSLVGKDLAKYPFTRETAQYVRKLGVNFGIVIGDFSNPDYYQIINRAEERIQEAVMEGIVSFQENINLDIEILSYPMSIVIVSAMKDRYLSRRYALAEAKKASRLLEKESEEKLITIAQTSFDWKVKWPVILDKTSFFHLNLIDYLKNASKFQDDKWKLINRNITYGHIYINKNDIRRLLEEEILRHIQTTIDNSPVIRLPTTVTEKMKSISQLLPRREGKIQYDFQLDIVYDAYPPCVKYLYDFVLKGSSLSHIGRFTLTTFLLNIGMSIEDIIKLYVSSSDFDGRLTRYQVEHIAGKKGSGTKYVTPSCSTLKTHSICTNMDDICKRIEHPIRYYLTKLKQLKDINE
jgi:DNA primase large subunit